jgi:16S rRNA (cytidine1402-2'-O)-methyltransferase
MKRAAQSGDKPSGQLYLVATPIGNLEDITLRALRVLQECDFIACEDTRQTQKLLNHFEIAKRLVSYHEHNELTRAPELVIELEQGAQIALVSDAGTPLVSDPGHRLVTLCLRHHIPVVPIPGPSALVAALAASGLPTDEFLFAGFLPSRAAERRETLRRLGSEPCTVVMYETPHRLNEALRDARELLGDRKACLAREITKVHEEFIRGTLSQLLDRVAERPPRGEMTLLIAPAVNGDLRPLAAAASPLSTRVEELMSAGQMDHKAALKQAARERGLNKREAYRRLLLERPGKPN